MNNLNNPKKYFNVGVNNILVIANNIVVIANNINVGVNNILVIVNNILVIANNILVIVNNILVIANNILVIVNNILVIANFKKNNKGHFRNSEKQKGQLPFSKKVYVFKCFIVRAWTVR